MLLAKAAATLNRVSEGRFYLGAGAGYLKSEYFALGVDFEERNALFEESLEVMQLHWSGQPFNFEGRHFSARDIQALPAPRGNSVPIWMGGNSDAALRRAAKYAAGWMPMTAPASVAKTARTPPVTTTEELRERLDVLQRFAGDRYEDLELILGYSGPGLSRFDQEAERVRQRLGELEDSAPTGSSWDLPGRPHPDRRSGCKDSPRTSFRPEATRHLLDAPRIKPAHDASGVAAGIGR